MKSTASKPKVTAAKEFVPASRVLQDDLFKALTRYQEGEKPKRPPTMVFSNESFEKLSVQQVIDAVVLMVAYLGMSGSGLHFDLYRLNQAYLLDPEKRIELNKVLEGWFRARGS